MCPIFFKLKNLKKFRKIQKNTIYKKKYTTNKKKLKKKHKSKKLLKYLKISTKKLYEICGQYFFHQQKKILLVSQY